MTPAKNSPDETSVTSNTSTEDAVEPNTEIVDTAEATPAPDKLTPAKNSSQPRYQNPRAIYKGPKIGIGPRGSRRSMGKR
jgi:hypothetical protein